MVLKSAPSHAFLNAKFDPRFEESNCSLLTANQIFVHKRPVSFILL